MEIGPYELGELLIASFVIFGAATVQGAVGFGFAVVCVPILTLVNPLMAPIPQLILAFPLTLFMALRERKFVNLKETGWLFVGRVIGLGLGLIVYEVANLNLLHLAIAAAVYAAAVFIAIPGSFRRTPLITWACGVASGVMSITSAIGGPAIALLYKNESGAVIRANLAAIFAISVTLSITLLAVTGAMTWVDVQTAALFFPPMALGLYLSKYWAHRVDRGAIRVLMVGLALVAASLLAVQTVYDIFKGVEPEPDPLQDTSSQRVQPRAVKNV